MPRWASSPNLREQRVSFSEHRTLGTVTEASGGAARSHGKRRRWMRRTLCPAASVARETATDSRPREVDMSLLERYSVAMFAASSRLAFMVNRQQVTSRMFGSAVRRSCKFTV